MKAIEEVDKLITWFEKNAPERGKVIRVNVTPDKLARWFQWRPKDPKEKPPSEYPYKGRTLMAVGREQS